jgi:hypothetical protein
MGEDYSRYGVFIIESMDLENEANGKLDGYILKTILDLCDIPNAYYYIRTKLEFENIILEFEKSEFRFLHISCHGNSKELCLTLESIKFSELETIIGQVLYHRRLFISACQVALFELAEHFVPKYHCFSVIGSPDNIDYDQAAIFWSSFYYLMYAKDSQQMVQVNILPTLLSVTKLFGVALNYFSIINNRYKNSIDHLREINIKNGSRIGDKVRLTKFRNQFRDPDSFFSSDREQYPES